MKKSFLIKSGKTHEMSTFHEIGGEKHPFGKTLDDGEFHLLYHTCMDGEFGGYMMHAVYAVAIGDRQYKIYVGEPPHKGDDGEWTTYNEVPTFVMGSFGGAHYIDKNPDKPHFVRMTVEEYDRETTDRLDETVQQLKNYKWMYENPETSYCAKWFFKSIFRKMIGFHGHVKGERMHLWWVRPKFLGVTFDFGKMLDGSEAFFTMVEENGWVRRLYVRRNGKLCLHYDKWENDGTCSSC